MMPSDTVAGFKFLERLPLYKTQKPYTIDYRISTWESGIPRSNYKSIHVGDIPVEDIRGRESEFTFEKNGFAILEMESSMNYEDFTDSQKIDGVYCHEVAACLLQYFPNAAAVQIYDTEVRRRHPLFPKTEMRPGMTTQPAQRVHIDGTHGSCLQVMKELGEAAKRYEGHLFVNVWRPLRGPLFDWPLAVCDVQSVDSQDLVEHDHVFTESVRENVMVYYNPKQRWYYLGGQTTSELLVFRQADSEGKPAVIHSAFDLPTESGGCTDAPRESIEVRAVICFDK